MSEQSLPHSGLDDQKSDPLTGHVYDDIQEYDNPAPGWWTWVFVLTVVFAALYWFVATASSGGLSPLTELEKDKTAETLKQFGSLGEITPDAPTLMKFAADSKWNAVGQSIFLGKCAACHNRDGSGINGPNLTDSKYIHVRKIEDILDVVQNGRNNGAMPAWRNTMSLNEAIMVSSYVSSLRGQNKAGKAPEPTAQDIEPWTAGQ
jgi:cytochrome c oxidase cbb3-type subunit 3